MKVINVYKTFKFSGLKVFSLKTGFKINLKTFITPDRMNHPKPFYINRILIFNKVYIIIITSK